VDRDREDRKCTYTQTFSAPSKEMRKEMIVEQAVGAFDGVEKGVVEFFGHVVLPRVWMHEKTCVFSQ